MAEQINIRQEVPADYPIVEALIRQAFWNLYEPGCAEHYLAMYCGIIRIFCRNWI